MNEQDFYKRVTQQPLMRKRLAKQLNTDDCICTICLESIKQDLSILGCKHFFHTACIKNWLTGAAPSCPCCRMDVREADTFEKVLIDEAAAKAAVATAKLRAHSPATLQKNEKNAIKEWLEKILSLYPNKKNPRGFSMSTMGECFRRDFFEIRERFVTLSEIMQHFHNVVNVIRDPSDPSKEAYIVLNQKPFFQKKKTRHICQDRGGYRSSQCGGGGGKR